MKEPPCYNTARSLQLLALHCLCKDLLFPVCADAGPTSLAEGSGAILARNNNTTFSGRSSPASCCMGVAVRSSPASATTTLGEPGHRRRAAEAVKAACACQPAWRSYCRATARWCSLREPGGTCRKQSPRRIAGDLWDHGSFLGWREHMVAPTAALASSSLPVRPGLGSRAAA